MNCCCCCCNLSTDCCCCCCNLSTVASMRSTTLTNAAVWDVVSSRSTMRHTASSSLRFLGFVVDAVDVDEEDEVEDEVGEPVADSTDGEGEPDNICWSCSCSCSCALSSCRSLWWDCNEGGTCIVNPMWLAVPFDWIWASITCASRSKLDLVGSPIHFTCPKTWRDAWHDKDAVCTTCVTMSLWRMTNIPVLYRMLTYSLNVSRKASTERLS